MSDAGEALGAVESLTAVSMFMSHCVLSLSDEMRDSAVEVPSAWWGVNPDLPPSLGG